jgi:predicted nuclease with TOPRIM domain
MVLFSYLCHSFRLRDLSLSKQAENEILIKHNETLEHRLKQLNNENESIKNDSSEMQTMIADLKEQVHIKN